MQITISLPHVFCPAASPVANARVLRILLDTLIDVNLAYLRDYDVPALYQSGVVYGRTKIWDCIPALYMRGFGDCKSLTAALIAQYRISGRECEPVFRFNPKPGKTDYHILVMRADGSFEDPSKKLGMGSNENAHY